MDSDPIRVLLVEDNQDYAWMLHVMLSEVETVVLDLTHVDQLHQAIDHLVREVYDVVLLDLWLGDSRGLNTFTEVYKHFPHIPIVVMTALDDKALALRAVRAGAQDYLVKGEMDVNLLVRSIQYAVERHRTTEHLRRLSMVDELTGLLNRRGFFALGMQHIKIAQRSDRQMLLLYSDLDGLKKINDHFGHFEGDQALKKIASILRETFRSSDLIARMGGDEFTVLAIDAAHDNAECILFRLQEKIKLHNDSNSPYKISLSIGTARFDPRHTNDLEAMLKRADQALYENKRLKKQAELKSDK